TADRTAPAAPPAAPARPPCRRRGSPPAYGASASTSSPDDSRTMRRIDPYSSTREPSAFVCFLSSSHRPPASSHSQCQAPAVGAVHLVGAAHLAARRLQHTAARVLEVLAGAEERLLPDDAGAADLFDLPVAVGDDPVARPQLRGLRPLVHDLHRVREDVALGAGR